MFYGKKAKKRLYIVKGLYLASCFAVVLAFTLALMLFAIAV